MQTSTKCYILVAVVVVLGWLNSPWWPVRRKRWWRSVLVGLCLLGGGVYGGLYWYAWANPWTSVAEQVLAPTVRADRLVHCLGDTDGYYQIAYGLADIGDAVLPDLLEQLDNEDESVRAHAIEALSWFRPPPVEIFPPLFAYLDDQASHNRAGAARMLGDVGGFARLWPAERTPELERLLGEAVPRLGGSLGDEDVHVRDAAARALGEIGDGLAVPALVASLRDGERGVRFSAAYALGQIGDASAIPALIDCLGDEDRSVRKGAAEALGRIGNPSAAPALIECLRDGEAWVRLYAVTALGEIGHPSAVPELEKLLDNEYCRRAAQQAVDQIRAAQDEG